MVLVFLATAKRFTMGIQQSSRCEGLCCKYQSQADLLVYKVDYKSQADGNKGLWFFTDYASQADKTIFTDYASQAVKVFC